MEALLIIIPSLSLLGKFFADFAIIIFFLYIVFLGAEESNFLEYKNRQLNNKAADNFSNDIVNKDFVYSVDSLAGKCIHKIANNKICQFSSNYFNQFAKKCLSYLGINVYNLKIEILFFLLGLLSCTWSVNKLYSISQVLSLSGLVYIFLRAAQISFCITNDKNSNYFKFLSLGLALAVFVFFIEYYTSGSITLFLRKIFQGSGNKTIFYLYALDRGSVFLSFISWIVITSFVCIKKPSYLKYLYSVAIYFSILFLLYKSDSLAGFLGFLFGGIIYIFLRLLTATFKIKFILNLIPVIILIANFSIPAFFYKMDTASIINKYQNILPDSAVHRLFIWNYSMKKSAESLFLGYGFASSKDLGKREIKTVQYKNHDFKLLPIHTHNILVQIILELGFVGFLIYNLFIFKFIRQVIISSYQNPNLLSFTLAAFASYYFVAMISFGIWQFWFVCTTLFVIFNFKVLQEKCTQENP